MKAKFSIKLISYFAPNCPRRILAPNCPRRIVQRRIVRAELSAPNCPAPNCPGTVENTREYAKRFISFYVLYYQRTQQFHKSALKHQLYSHFNKRSEER